MNFLFISPRFAGGIGGHAYMLSEQLRKSGHEVELMPTTHLPIKNLKNPSFALISSLKSLTNRNHYDIVHAFNVPSAFAMKHIKAKKKVLSIHGPFSQAIDLIHSKPYGLIGNLMEKKALQYADKITTDSKYTKKIYKETTGIDFEYLPSPIDITKFKNIKKSLTIKNQVAYVARADYGKGIDILEKAEPLIKGNVVYCTDLPWNDAMEVLSKSHVLVQPSRMESLATTIKEAFYLKIPVVATQVGGNPELVKHEVTGLLTPSENPTKLAESINRILDDDVLSKQICENSYNFVINNMTWESILPKYIEFYENLLKN